jgi:hypothetical protein
MDGRAIASFWAVACWHDQSLITTLYQYILHYDAEQMISCVGAGGHLSKDVPTL